MAGDGKNVPDYKNPKVDELYLKGGAINDQAARKKIYQEIEAIILKDMVVLPLFDIPYVRGYNKRVRDFPAHNSAHPLLRTTWNNVWLEKNK